MVVLIPEDTRANLIAMTQAGGLYGASPQIGGVISPIPYGGGFWDTMKKGAVWTFNNIIKPIGEPVLKSAISELGSVLPGVASNIGSQAGAKIGSIGTKLLSSGGGTLPQRTVSKFITPN